MATGTTSSSIPSISLNGGYSIPQLGFGVYEVDPRSTTQAVREALEAGYRHIDTASCYGNETQVGAALAASGIPRDQVFVTTKCWTSEMGRTRAISACERSLKKLELSYVDLYLVHAPLKNARVETWAGLEELQKRGKVRSIGVSNYSAAHLEELARVSDVKPAVNQIEITPYNTRTDIADYCKENGIVIEAYCPLTRGAKLRDPKLLRLQKTRYPDRTPAQLLLRWAVQKGFVVLPKSVHKNRMVENMDVFDWELAEEDVEEMDGWDEYLVMGELCTRVK
ncbi:oxidoreductase [Gonapodya prolifera JEL478]|uniref:Oxidoreductase n=1 Tax=Gonapodya prolifera (strain JEL478) TaxID=1344416 RepID=A0A139AUP0_GONPJ|nr:oxidoreductase [Gonapodya prolifera JEL478]|eukprot:KXS20205.1 oxidoreductase [Gonapodya prolifera JEL478]